MRRHVPHGAVGRMLKRRLSGMAATKGPVGLIGLGQMGGRMANNLRKHGYELVVCDPVAANVQTQLEQGGAMAASTPRDVAERCDTIMTMLPSTAAVESVYLGADGVHEALRDEHLLFDSSTIDPIATKKLSEELHARGATFVDAPVSGGVAGAQNGTLTFMVGGTDAEFERVKPVLMAMGKNIVHCGGSGTGQVAKICNNLAAAIQLTSVAEATNLGVKLGIDAGVLASNHPYPGVMPLVPASNGYEGGFAVRLMRKDLGLAVGCAMDTEVSVPLTNSVLQLFNMMTTQGNGDKDFSYILPFLKGDADGNDDASSGQRL